MSRRITRDLTGEVFERLTVISEIRERRRGSVFWKCRCVCGNIVEVPTSRLNLGRSKSCGCIRDEKLYKHGHASYINGVSITYKSYGNMKRRCLEKTRWNYQFYGGRGIVICDRWLNSFDNFLEDMGERPSIEYELDRKDSNGNYEPNNCQWNIKGNGKKRPRGKAYQYRIN